MKGKMVYRLLGLLLAGIMAFENVDVTAFAAETETMTETVSSEQETAGSQESEESQFKETLRNIYT